MKKFIAFVLCLLFVCTVFCGCGKDSNTDNSTSTQDEAVATTPTVSPEDALTRETVQIYVDNRAVWEYTQNDSEWYGYHLLDLNFDGVLELVQATNTGADASSSNRYFKLDTENKTVTELSCVDKELDSKWDFVGGDYPQLYKNNSTGDLKYLVYSNRREGISSGGMSIGEMTLNEKGEVTTKNLWAFDYAALTDDLDGEFSFSYYVYDENGDVEEVDADTYNATLAEYEENNTRLTFTYAMADQVLEEVPFSELSDEELLERMLEMYKSFSYN